MALTGKRILLTGGAGFIGTSLARRLVADNELVVLDNLHRDSLTGTDLAEHPNLRFVQGDILDLDLVRTLTKDASHVVHMAAIAGVDKVLESPVRTMRVNLIGTSNVLEAAQEAGTVERLVDFSTSEVFGTHAYKVEETHVTSQGSVGEARWTYAVSKLAGEYLAHSYFDEYGLPAVSVRPFNVYGPGQVGIGAIHHFTVRALRARSSSSTATARRSAPGATSTTWSRRCCSCSRARRPSGRSSTSATRARWSRCSTSPRGSSGWRAPSRRYLPPPALHRRRDADPERRQG